MNSKNKWNFTFLGLTALVLGMEVFAAFDGNRDTQPWTYLIVNNISPWITFPAIIGIATWLIFHFKKFYKIKKNSSTGKI